MYKILNFIIPKFLIKKIKKNFFPYYFLITNYKKLPPLNYINQNHYDDQKKLIEQFKINQKQNSFMTCPYLHNLLKMLYSYEQNFSFLDIGGESIDFFLQLKKNFKNVKYYIFNLEKINNNFEKLKEEFFYDDLIIIKNLDFANLDRYDFVNLGSSIQYFDNYKTVLSNIAKISNNIFFSGTTLYESRNEECQKHIIVKQINCFPDINYCYFFNKNYFYDFFYKNDFKLIFESKNFTDKINFKNFENLCEDIDYSDFFFVRKN